PVCPARRARTRALPAQVRARLRGTQLLPSPRTGAGLRQDSKLFAWRARAIGNLQERCLSPRQVQISSPETERLIGGTPRQDRQDPILVLWVPCANRVRQ